jgi:hypothetical protein
VKTLITLLSSIAISTHVYASEVSFNMYRWNENYSHLVDKRGNSWYDQLKYTPLGKDAYISFGGTLRHRLNMYDNDNFGLRGVVGWLNNLFIT